VADGVQEVRFAEAGIPIDKKWIIGIAGRLTYGDAACMGEPIAGAYDEIIKGVIGMERRLIFALLRRGTLLNMAIGGKLDGNQMPGYLLGGPGKGALAVGLQELGTRIVRTADFERAARQMHDAEIVKPLSGVDGVQGLCTVKDIREDIFYFAAGQVILLYSR
jgi:hypothetical protein